MKAIVISKYNDSQVSVIFDLILNQQQRLGYMQGQNNFQISEENYKKVKKIFDR